MRKEQKLTTEELMKILSKEFGDGVETVRIDPDGDFTIIYKGVLERLGDDKMGKVNNFFENFLIGLKVMTHPHHPNSVFFYRVEGGKKVGWMEQDYEAGRLWCRWDGLWEVLLRGTNLTYSEVSDVIGVKMEDHTETPNFDQSVFLDIYGQPRRKKLGMSCDDIGEWKVSGWSSILNHQ